MKKTLIANNFNFTFEIDNGGVSIFHPLYIFY